MKMTTSGWQVPPFLDKVYHRCFSLFLSEYSQYIPVVVLLKSPVWCLKLPRFLLPSGDLCSSALPLHSHGVIRHGQGLERQPGNLKNPWKPSLLEPSNLETLQP